MLTTGITATMTSREIADLVESRHDKVKQSIERLAERGIFQLPPLGEVRNHLGQTVAEYLVGKRESYIIVAQLSPEFTARLVDRWQELEARAPASIDLNDPAALRSLLLGYSEKVMTLEAKVSADAPKVQFAETIRNMDAVCHIGEVAKMIGIGPNRLFKRLREDKVLMKNNIPYQCYIDRDYFTLIEGRPYFDKKGASHPTFTPMVTGAGQVYLQRKYQNITGAA